MDSIIDNIASPIFTLLMGVCATVLVARYYFIRTIGNSKKSIATYLDYFTEVFSGVNHDVREALEITYQNKIVNDLVELQYIIVNSGESTIKDLIKPLTLLVPKSSKILDASIVYVSPKGREISRVLDFTNNAVIFRFDLLNKSEFFVVKLLLDGRSEPNEFEFTITEDELSPVLKTESLLDLAKYKDEGRPVFRIFIGIAFITLSSIFFPFTYYSWSKMPDYAGQSIFTYFGGTLPLWGVLLMSLCIGGLIFFAGLVYIVSGIFDIHSIRQREKTIKPLIDVVRSRGKG